MYCLMFQADKIINEQQLGVAYDPPSESFFEYFNHKTTKKTKADNTENSDIGPVAKLVQELAMKYYLSSDDTINKNGLYGKNMKHMIDLLCNEAGFLVLKINDRSKKDYKNY